MVTCEESKESKVEEKITKEQCMEILSKVYPEKETQQRFIKHLWDEYYRVNYFFAPTERFTACHFVRVHQNGTIEKMD